MPLQLRANARLSCSPETRDPCGVRPLNPFRALARFCAFRSPRWQTASVSSQTWAGTERRGALETLRARSGRVPGRGSRGVAATLPPRNIHVPAARSLATEYPRPSRGVAATRLYGISTTCVATRAVDSRAVPDVVPRARRARDVLPAFQAPRDAVEPEVRRHEGQRRAAQDAMEADSSLRSIRLRSTIQLGSRGAAATGPRI